VATCGRLRPEQVVSFEALKSKTVADLPGELRAKKIDYVIYTWIHFAAEDDAKHPRQLRRFRPDLLERFEKGDPVPGFAHVTTLDVPERARRKDTQVYRVVGAGRTAPKESPRNE
jgi:hypothetical protein